MVFSFFITILGSKVGVHFKQPTNMDTPIILDKNNYELFSFAPCCNILLGFLVKPFTYDGLIEPLIALRALLDLLYT